MERISATEKRLSRQRSFTITAIASETGAELQGVLIEQLLLLAEAAGDDHHPRAVVLKVSDALRLRLVVRHDPRLRMQGHEYLYLRVHHRTEGLVDAHMDGP
jgi:hypothetical protein